MAAYNKFVRGCISVFVVLHSGISKKMLLTVKFTFIDTCKLNKVVYSNTFNILKYNRTSVCVMQLSIRRYLFVEGVVVEA